MLSFAEKILLQAEYDAGKPFFVAVTVATPERRLAAQNLWREWRNADPTSVR